MESRPSRPQRNRRHSRRAWPPEDDLHLPRPVKRLFTPEIKRMLKDWLIRRRENPYPSRDEKKRLAIETGLTYTQICNWFANWRRKLKNSEHEKAKKSWGHLIKNYNTNARGNVEQFSISSEDSIWDEGANRGEDDGRTDDEEDFFTGSDIEREDETRGQYKATTSYLQAPHTPKFYMEAVRMEHSNYYPGESGYNTTAQCYQISSTTHDTYEMVDDEENHHQDVTNEAISQQQPQKAQVQQQQQQQQKTFSIANKAKYKQQIMEKYLRDTHESSCCQKKMATPAATNCGAEFSKWLESAAKFRPNKNNYFIGWNRKRNKQEKRQRPKSVLVRALQTPTMQQTQQKQQQQQHHHIYDTIHHKDELDAAEALANLAFNCRQRMLDSQVLIQTHPSKAIPST